MDLRSTARCRIMLPITQLIQGVKDSGVHAGRLYACQDDLLLSKSIPCISDIRRL
jgi:hypothetical protein